MYVQHVSARLRFVSNAEERTSQVDLVPAEARLLELLPTNLVLHSFLVSVTLRILRQICRKKGHAGIGRVACYSPNAEIGACESPEPADNRESLGFRGAQSLSLASCSSHVLRSGVADTTASDSRALGCPMASLASEGWIRSALLNPSLG